jgi:pilus assembly protein Flp/PilA
MFKYCKQWMDMVRVHLGRDISREDGQAMVEYGIIIAMIAVGVIAVLVTLGPKIKNAFQSVDNALS